MNPFRPLCAGLAQSGRASLAAVALMLLLSETGSAQMPQFTYRATRYMPQPEYADFTTLAEAEQFIRTEPPTPRGNAWLERTELRPVGASTVFEYKVPWRTYETYIGDFYDGHVSGNSTDCWGMKCESEEEMVAASLRAYPLLNSYTATLRGAYLSPPHSMWGGNGRRAHVVMNAVQYSGAEIPNQRLVSVIAPSGAEHYLFRPNRSDVYECPELFFAIDNSFGEPNRGIWPLFCINGATGSIQQISRQKAPTCEIDPLNGNPCASDTGNKEYREVDFSWNGYDFARRYNSVADFPLLSGFGDNWAHTFSDRLTLDVRKDPVYWVRSDGYFETLTYVAPGQYRPSDSKNAVLRRETDTQRAQTHGVWQLQYPDGTSLYFNALGRLQRSDRGGEWVSFDYCTATDIAAGDCVTPEQIARAVHSSGRTLTFHYGSIAVAGSDTALRPQARLLRIRSAGQTLVEYGYDDSARLVNARDDGPGGVGRAYRYGEAAQLCRDARNTVFAGCNPAHFPAHLTGVIGEDGVPFSRYSYDDKGRVVISEYADGIGRVTQDFVSATRVDVGLPGGASKTYTFNNDAFRRPVQETTLDAANGQSRTLSVGYAGDRASHFVDAGGSRTQFTNDALHETARTEGLSATGSTTSAARNIQTDWDSASNRPSERRTYDNAGNLQAQSRWTYNARGQELTDTLIDNSTAAAHRITTTSYCEQADLDAGACPRLGLVTRIDGPRTDVSDLVLFSYYASDDPACAATPASCAYRKGDLWKVTNALGQVDETLRYDDAGRALQRRDANGVVTAFSYDDEGRLLVRSVHGSNAASNSDDAVTRFEYTPTGLLKKVVQPDASVLFYDYDAAHRLSSISDTAGNRIRYTLDDAGNRTQEEVKDAGGTLRRAVSGVYDSLSQLRQSRNAEGDPTLYRYDSAGNLDQYTDALGTRTSNEYDALNRLSRNLGDSGGIGAETRYQYDALNRRTGIVDARGLGTEYRYDTVGNLVELRNADTGNSSYAYDSAGNRTRSTDARGETAVYRFDALNRLSAIEYGDASLNSELTYDSTPAVCSAAETTNIGYLTRLDDASGSTEYCYDRFGNLLRKVQTSNGVALTLNYAYDLAGNLVSLTYPSGMRVDYARDARGQIQSTALTQPGQPTQPLLTQVNYHPFGPAAELHYANGRTLTRTLDQNYAPFSIQDNRPGGLSLGYEYDARGYLTKLRRGDQSEPALRRYVYDALGRLTHTYDAGTDTLLQSYSYDVSGNRTGMTDAGVSRQYTYSATSNRLDSVDGIGRSYDENGNTVSIGSAANAFVYNAAGRLQQVSRNGNPAVSYAYNGKGEQLQRNVQGNLTYSLSDEQGNWLGDYDSNGVARREAIWLDELPVGLLDQGKLYYVQADHLGTPRAVIDPVRDETVWRWSLAQEVFGDSVPEQDPDADTVDFSFDLRLPGQRHDSASGFNYNRFRDYEPATGRYLQSDPVFSDDVTIGLPDPTDPYAYVEGNPLTLLDAQGLQGFTTYDACVAKHGPEKCGGSKPPGPRSNKPQRKRSTYAAYCRCNINKQVGCDKRCPDTIGGRGYSDFTASNALRDCELGAEQNLRALNVRGCQTKHCHGVICFKNGSPIRCPKWN